MIATLWHVIRFIGISLTIGVTLWCFILGAWTWSAMKFKQPKQREEFDE